jgi:hypothetical protein
MKNALTCLFMLLSTSVAHADEGMWTLDNLPLKQLQQDYGFAPSAAWQDRVLHASLRMAQGCSGSFVSADGLVMTNHHCAEQCISQLSSPEHDFVANGFVGIRDGAERACPELEFDQLESIADVTPRVSAATGDKSGAQRISAERSVTSAIEQECNAGGDAKVIRCDVVSLYHGGRYALYKYRRYQDVRLVFAPEAAIAAFGGDPDNFNFPRFDLDVTFLRVYVDGRPAHTDFFPFSKSGPKAGDLVFVVGNPGGTERNDTVAQLIALRSDFLTPFLAYLSDFHGMIWQYGRESGEHARQSNDDLLITENALKVFKGQLETLNDDAVLESKQHEEDELRAWVNADPARKAKYGNAWDELAGSLKAGAELGPRYRLVERGSGFSSDLYADASILVRYAAERGKPDADRLPRYRDANLPALRQQALSSAPIYPELEETKLAWSLEKLRQGLGADDPLVQEILGSDSPDTVARRLVEGSKLADVNVRKQLWEGGEAAIEASNDPMIKLARMVDPQARMIRKDYEARVEGVAKKNSALIAEARFAREGLGSYPDATFTLRLSYGAVKGWDEHGVAVPPFTDFAGLYRRATGSDPFKLPASWIAAQSKIDLATPFDLVTTNDVIGGNSGSPMIDRDGDVVGLVFDGNIHSIGGNFVYDKRLNRTVAVDSAALEYSVRHVYGDTTLADELVTGHRSGAAM